ncbi:hypothetical protein HF1_02600 [Mycoplasma haemofelis str. Langford 1]|uniref:Uncharacterized protein n=1 Tax=Mycoplasma haemofelis (strain Langford 1) TaxID=941640 RepID=E8ZKV2_MYCHL|nr:hypothetical protein [Mycoplasma haemofelis]CBY92268.1 hypothetical protein HF1_02600 [Mycoplasma haemofelis str. Langford 1]
MSIPLPAKVATGVLVGGTAAAGGSFLYKGTSKPQTYSIKDLLASKNPEKRLISTSDSGSSAEWKAAWKAYRDTYKDRDSNPFSLTATQLKDSSSDPNAPNELISGCKSLFMEQVVDTEGEKYKTVLGYCTRNTLVKDLILESNRNLMPESGGNWGEIWKDYRKANEGKGKDQDTWKLTDWENKKDQDSSASDDLPKKCKTKLETSSGVKTVNDYQDVVNWCSTAK